MAIVRDEARRNAKKLDDKDSPNAIWKNIRVQEATRSGRRIGGVVMRVGVAGGARLRAEESGARGAVGGPARQGDAALAACMSSAARTRPRAALHAAGDGDQAGRRDREGGVGIVRGD